MKRPKLVILDAHTANPGDLSWAPLEALADCVIHDRTPPAEVPERIRGRRRPAEQAVLDARSIAAAPRLRYVGILATGCNTIDLTAARERGWSFPTCPATAPRPSPSTPSPFCWS
jgi:glycerate dehydrogenase